MRRRRVAIPALLLALSLTACAVEDSVEELITGHKRHEAPPDPAVARATNYDRAVKLKGEGNCAAAIPLFEPLAKLGKGYEVAQLQLGQCYLQVAGTASTAAAADADRANAAKWILLAANSDQPSAQEQAAKLLLNGTGIAADPIEAGKWFLLLQRNPLRSIIGPATPDPALQQALQRQLTAAQWQEATSRADQWKPAEQASAAKP